MQLYVCGFLFSHDRTHVTLIRKNRPAWQKGKLNGLGGKIEPGETPLQAMQREFLEEAGVSIQDWHEAVTLRGDPSPADPKGWQGHFFRAFAPPALRLQDLHPQTDEQIEIHPVHPLPKDTIPNLHWLIPLLLDDDVTHNRAYQVIVAPKM
jgi:8-oxo-dGTP diphosphatase